MQTKNTMSAETRGNRNPPGGIFSWAVGKREEHLYREDETQD